MAPGPTMFCVIGMESVKHSQSMSGLLEQQAAATTKAKAAFDAVLARTFTAK